MYILYTRRKESIEESHENQIANPNSRSRGHHRRMRRRRRGREAGGEVPVPKTLAGGVGGVVLGALVEVAGVAQRVVPEVAGEAAAAPHPRHEVGDLLRAGADPRRRRSEERRRRPISAELAVGVSAGAEAAGEADGAAELLLQRRGRRAVAAVELHWRALSARVFAFGGSGIRVRVRVEDPRKRTGKRERDYL